MLPIARKQRGIEMLNDCGDVERLIADAVTVAAAIEDGDETEGQGACGQRRPVTLVVINQ